MEKLRSKSILFIKNTIDPVLLVVFLFLGSSVFLELIGPKGILFPSLIQLIWFVFYLLLLIVFSTNFQDLVLAIKNNKMIVFITMFAFISVIWSIDKTLTFKRSIALLFTNTFAIYAARRFDLYTVLRYLRVVLIVMIILSFILVYLYPEAGIHQTRPHLGLWRGVFHHKNLLGRVMTFSMFIFTFLLTRKWNRLNFLFLLLSLFLLIQSSSKTGLIVLIVLYPVTLLIAQTRVRDWKIPLWGFVLSILAVLATYLFIEFYTEIFLLLEKREDLSGRTIIWGFILLSVLKEPLLGYGYNAFWDSLENNEAANILADAGWEVTHAHNGFLQLSVDLGLLGLLIFLIYLFRGFNKVRSAYDSFRGMNSFPLLYLIFFVLFNVTQTILLNQNNIFWFMMAYSIAIVNEKKNSSI